MQLTGLQLEPPTQMFDSQVQSLGQTPHSTASPQPSPILPQYWAPAGLQATLPHAGPPAVPLVPPVPITIAAAPPAAVLVGVLPLATTVAPPEPPAPEDEKGERDPPGCGLQHKTSPSSTQQARPSAGARPTEIRFVTARTFRVWGPRSRHWPEWRGTNKGVLVRRTNPKEELTTNASGVKAVERFGIRLEPPLLAGAEHSPGIVQQALGRQASHNPLDDALGQDRPNVQSRGSTPCRLAPQLDGKGSLIGFARVLAPRDVRGRPRSHRTA